MFGRLCISAAYIVVILHTAELFPTQVRNSSIGAGSTMSHVGSILAPYVVDFLVRFIYIFTLLFHLSVHVSIFPIFLYFTLIIFNLLIGNNRMVYTNHNMCNHFNLCRCTGYVFTRNKRERFK